MGHKTRGGQHRGAQVGSPRGTVRTRRAKRHRAATLLAVLAALVVGSSGVWAAMASGRVDPPWDGDGGCSAPHVRVAAAPEIAAVVRTAVSGPADGRHQPCPRVRVLAQPPAATARSSTTGAAGRWPQVWVPDSSLWAARAPGFAARRVVTLATSPLVLATNRATSTALGWDHSPPSWATALEGVRPVVVHDLGSDARGLGAVIALRTSLGGGPDADRAVAAAALASARGGDAAPDGVSDIPDDGADAPLVPLAEQQVVAAHRPNLVAVYPKGGSPSLDYPVLRVPAAATSEAQRDAVDRVVAALSTPRVRTLLGRVGFRDPRGAGSLPATDRQVAGVPLPDATALQTMLIKLQLLAKPTRMLAVLDVSTSMRAPAGARGTRAQVLRDAAIDAVSLMPGRDLVGAWLFAARLSPGHDYAPAVPVQSLQTPENGHTHRDTVVAALRQLPSRLTPGGTGLYSTVRDAVLEMQRTYDPGASNVVVLLTDGRNDRSGGPSLSSLLSTLQRSADPKRPVRVVAVGISGEADMGALTQIASATPGGRAYLAERPEALRSVLFDALTSR